jgi:hypothetical protein
LKNYGVCIYEEWFTFLTHHLETTWKSLHKTIKVAEDEGFSFNTSVSSLWFVWMVSTQNVILMPS